MPEGGQLTIAAALVTAEGRDGTAGLDFPPGPIVQIEVHDSGTGIAASVIDRIFDPFFTTKEPGKGTGLGLSTSLAIVRRHGGQIRALSDPGRGACFRVYLPACTGAGAAGPIAEPSAVPHGSGQTILVVHDEAAIRVTAKRALEASGYRVLLASNGAEAIAAFGASARSIAAVIMDMTMPELDGVPAIHAIVSINPSIPIIAASGIAANGPPALAASVQVKMFLPKPFTSDTLLKALHQVLG